MEKKLLEYFIKKNCKRQIRKSLDERPIKKKCDKSYVKWKDYQNSFNSWIDKKDVI